MLNLILLIIGVILLLGIFFFGCIYLIALGFSNAIKEALEKTFSEIFLGWIPKK